jgi:hypothetical protein
LSESRANAPRRGDTVDVVEGLRLIPWLIERLTTKLAISPFDVEIDSLGAEPVRVRSKINFTRGFAVLNTFVKEIVRLVPNVLASTPSFLSPLPRRTEARVLVR